MVARATVEIMNLTPNVCGVPRSPERCLICEIRASRVSKAKYLKSFLGLAGRRRLDSRAWCQDNAPASNRRQTQEAEGRPRSGCRGAPKLLFGPGFSGVCAVLA